MKHTSKKLIQRAVARMILRHPFYANVILSTDIDETDEVPTAATDGERIKYNPEFLQKFNVDEIAFILSHEVEHIVRLHCFRRDSRDPMVWNEAADHGINLDLIAAGLKAPTSDNGEFLGLADTQYKDWSADKVYNHLMQNRPPPQSGGGQPGGGQPGDGEGEGQGQGDPSNIFAGDMQKPAGGDVEKQSEAERRVRGRILSAAQQTKMSKGIGSIPAHLRQMIDDLTEPQVDWRSELRDLMMAFTTNDYIWSRTNRRLRHRGIKMPAMRSEAMGGMAIIIDTSGSCHSEIPNFLSELSGIVALVQPQSMHVMFIDTAIQQYVETTADNFEADMGDLMRHPPHGGGTDLRPAFDWIDKNSNGIDAVVCLTDLYTPWPDNFQLGDRTLFVDTDRRNQTPPFGRCVDL